MKQVEYISIGGYVFSLEDSASRAAKEYLDQLEAFYSRKESGAEVMEGIEERMAELLLLSPWSSSRWRTVFTAGMQIQRTMYTSGTEM